MKPTIAIYQGQSLAPPDQKGQKAGTGMWCKIGDNWYRLEANDQAHKVKAILEDVFCLRKWPFEEQK